MKKKTNPAITGKALPACMARALAPMAPPQSVVHQIARHPREHSTEVQYGGVTYEVAYDYQPAEAPVYDLESPWCGPGCPAEVEIYAIRHRGEDITDIVSEAVTDELEALVLGQIE